VIDLSINEARANTKILPSGALTELTLTTTLVGLPTSRLGTAHAVPTQSTTAGASTHSKRLPHVNSTVKDRAR